MVEVRIQQLANDPEQLGQVSIYCTVQYLHITQVLELYCSIQA